MNGRGSCVSSFEELRAQQWVAEFLELPLDESPEESEDIWKKIKRWIILMDNSWPGGADLAYTVDLRRRLITRHSIVGSAWIVQTGKRGNLIEARCALVKIFDIPQLVRHLVSYYKASPFFRREVNDMIDTYGGKNVPG